MKKLSLILVASFAVVLTSGAKAALSTPVRPESFPLSRPNIVNGTVIAWGDNSYGQTNIPAGLTGVVQISAGFGGTVLALKSDGKVVAWGANTTGAAKVPTDLSGVVQVAAAYMSSVALKSDGTVRIWGAGFNAIPPIPFVPTPVKIENIVQISSSYGHLLALKRDGTVVAYGHNAQGQCDVPSGLNHVVQVSAGDHHSLALKSDGSVVSWGAKSISGLNTLPVGLTGVVQVVAGSDYSLAILKNGSVVAWGSNLWKYQPYSVLSIPAGLVDITQVEAGAWVVLALKNNGTVTGWGLSDLTGMAFTPSDLPRNLTNIRQVSFNGPPGGSFGIALRGTPGALPSTTPKPTPKPSKNYNFSDDSSYWRSIFPVQSGFTVTASNAGSKPFAISPTIGGGSSSYTYGNQSYSISSSWQNLPVTINGFRPGKGGTVIALDYYFMNLRLASEGASKILKYSYNGWNPFLSFGSIPPFLKLVQNRGNCEIWATYDELNLSAAHFGITTYNFTQNKIAVLNGVKAADLTEDNFYSYIVNSHFSPR